MVVAQVDLEGAGAAPTDRPPHLGPVPAAALVAAALAGDEPADLGIASEEGRAEARSQSVGVQPMRLGDGVKRPPDQRRLETVIGLRIDPQARSRQEAAVAGVD